MKVSEDQNYIEVTKILLALLFGKNYLIRCKHDLDTIIWFCRLYSYWLWRSHSFASLWKTLSCCLQRCWQTLLLAWVTNTKSGVISSDPLLLSLTPLVCPHYTQSPGVLAAWVGHLYYLWSPSRDPRTPSGPVSVRRCHCWWPKVDGNSALSAKGHSQVSELLGTLEGWSLTFKPVHGTADTDWISILKYIILTLIQEHNVLSAHDWFTVSCTSHTHAAPQAAAGATNA